MEDVGLINLEPVVCLSADVFWEMIKRQLLPSLISVKEWKTVVRCDSCAIQLVGRRSRWLEPRRCRKCLFADGSWQMIESFEEKYETGQERSVARIRSQQRIILQSNTAPPMARPSIKPSTKPVTKRKRDRPAKVASKRAKKRLRFFTSVLACFQYAAANLWPTPIL